MTDIPIFVSSVNGIRNSRPGDFVVSFSSPITLDKNKDHFIALDSLDMSYSWYNVSAVNYDNHIIHYSADGGSTWHEIAFYDGNYMYKDLSAYISNVMVKNGDSKTGIKLTFVKSFLKVLVEVEAGYQLDLRSGNFSTLVGFEKKIVTQTEYGTISPNITNSIDNINVHCNLISDSIVSSDESDILHRFSVDNLILSYPFRIEGLRTLFNKISTSTIKEIRIRLSDSLNRPINLNNVPVNMTLLLRSS